MKRKYLFFFFVLLLIGCKEEPEDPILNSPPPPINTPETSNISTKDRTSLEAQQIATMIFSETTDSTRSMIAPVVRNVIPLYNKKTE